MAPAVVAMAIPNPALITTHMLVSPLPPPAAAPASAAMAVTKKAREETTPVRTTKTAFFSINLPPFSPGFEPF
jgi:hypothetical protein